MNDDRPASPPRASGLTKAITLLALALFANAAVSLYTRGKPADISFSQSAFAQALQAPNAQELLGARGLFLMPAQLGPQTYGAYLFDVDSSTIVAYRMNDAETPHARFELLTARSFKNDRFLENWNTAKPTPAEIANIVQQQRQRTGLQKGTDAPTVDQTAPVPEPANGPDLSPVLPVPSNANGK